MSNTEQDINLTIEIEYKNISVEKRYSNLADITLYTDLPSKEQVKLSRLSVDQISDLHRVLGIYINAISPQRQLNN